jgi:RIO-like serine/threonine protein kinase
VEDLSEEEYDKRVEEYLKIGRENSVFVCRDKKTNEVVSVIKFARAEWEDWEEIKKMSTEELKEHYISLSISMDYSVSVRDCEFEDLMAMELQRRGVKYEEVEPIIKRGIKNLHKALGEEI